MKSKYFKISVVLLCLLALTIPSNAQTAPSEAGIPPFPGAPACPTHDDTQYHGLWDSVRGCHYDHTHNDDPALADSIFGSAGAAWGGQTISYPFMTPNENDGMGHSGYKYFVNLNSGCAAEGFEWMNPQPHCVSAFRVMYHDAGGNAHAMKRFHSYYMEGQIRSLDGKVTGTIQTGGWQDFGCIHLPYKEALLLVNEQNPLNSDGSNRCGVQQSIHNPPYRALLPLDEALQRASQNRQTVVLWSPGETYGYNQLAGVSWRTFDTASGVMANDPYAEHFICPDFHCRYNNSEHGIVSVSFTIPRSLDTNNDGIVNYTGYTDVKGNIVQSCNAPSTNCVPLRIVNAPVGVAVWSIGGTPPSPITPKLNVHDGDIYFNGQPSGWIQIHGHSNHSPTSTPPSSGPFVSTEVNPTSLNIGGTASVGVNLNNVPVEGYKSAEFMCTYNAGLVEKSNIVAANLFGADAAVAIHEHQTGTFIVAIAGTNGNKATTSGPVLTFSAKGLQAGQSPIQCTARVSKGDNVPIDLPSTGANLTIGVEPSPTPLGFPTATPGEHQQPTATNVPLGSPTPTASFTPLPSPDGSLTGQVIASKPVTVSLLDANSVVVSSVVANPDGTFSLTALAGNYTVVATASGFLSHQGSAILTAGNTTSRPTISLLAGDIDGNNVIDQFDALTIGMGYTTSTPAAADLNNDGTIDFLDLELLAENYRKTGPSVWE